MAAPNRISDHGAPSNRKIRFWIQAAAASITIDAPTAGERYVITHIYAVGTVTALTLTNIEPNSTLDIGDHPGLGEPIVFPDGTVMTDIGEGTTVTATGATKMVVMGYVVNDITN